jgi:flavin-dependent dehydrogenase
MEEVAFGYGPRRSVLDKILVDAAIDAGSELREGFFAEDFLAEDNRLVGIRGRSNPGGHVMTEKAQITIGADGRKSHLARTVRAPMYQSTPALTCWYFSYWSGVPNDGLEIYRRQRRVIFAFPTNNDLLIRIQSSRNSSLSIPLVIHMLERPAAITALALRSLPGFFLSYLRAQYDRLHLNRSAGKLLVVCWSKRRRRTLRNQAGCSQIPDAELPSSNHLWF